MPERGGPRRGNGSSSDSGGIGGILRGIGSRIGAVSAIIAAIVLAYTGYYQVEPEEVALVTRLGKYMYTAQPGPHFKLPFGIDNAIKVPVQRQLKEEFGFRTTRSDVRSEYETPEDSQHE